MFEPHKAKNELDAIIRAIAETQATHKSLPLDTLERMQMQTLMLDGYISCARASENILMKSNPQPRPDTMKKIRVEWLKSIMEHIGRINKLGADYPLIRKACSNAEAELVHTIRIDPAQTYC